MAENLGKRPSKRGPISKIRPSDGCGRGAVLLAVERWYDFGYRSALGRPFARIFRHPVALLLSFFAFRGFPWPTAERVFAVDHRSGSGFSGTVIWHANLGRMERDVPAMADNLGGDLDQLLP